MIVRWGSGFRVHILNAGPSRFHTAAPNCWLLPTIRVILTSLSRQLHCISQNLWLSWPNDEFTKWIEGRDKSSISRLGLKQFFHEHSSLSLFLLDWDGDVSQGNFWRLQSKDSRVSAAWVPGNCTEADPHTKAQFLIVLNQDTFRPIDYSDDPVRTHVDVKKSYYTSETPGTNGQMI